MDAVEEALAGIISTHLATKFDAAPVRKLEGVIEEAVSAVIAENEEAEGHKDIEPAALETDGAKMAKEISTFVKTLFPHSYVNAWFSVGIAPSVHVSFSLQDKKDWKSGIFENDLVGLKFLIFGFDKDGKAGNLEFKVDGGISFRMRPAPGSRYHFDPYKERFPAVKGSAEKVLAGVKRYFERLKKALAQNIDKLPEGVDYSKLIVESVVSEVSDKKVSVKVTFQNGDHLVSTINTDLEGAKEYYLGKSFNIGFGGDDNMQKAVKVELVGGSVKNEATSDFKDPTADEMRQFLHKQFEGSGLDDMDADVEGAIYWYATHYHGGQSSSLYSASSTSQYKPARSESGPEEDSIMAHMYEALEDKYGKEQTVTEGRKPINLKSEAAVQGDNAMTPPDAKKDVVQEGLGDSITIHFNGAEWVVTKIDGTHFRMSMKGSGRQGSALHIRQIRGQPYATQIEEFLRRPESQEPEMQEEAGTNKMWSANKSKDRMIDAGLKAIQAIVQMCGEKDLGVKQQLNVAADRLAAGNLSSAHTALQTAAERAESDELAKKIQSVQSPIYELLTSERQSMKQESTSGKKSVIDSIIDLTKKAGVHRKAGEITRAVALEKKVDALMAQAEEHGFGDEAQEAETEAHEAMLDECVRNESAGDVKEAQDDAASAASYKLYNLDPERLEAYLDRYDHAAPQDKRSVIGIQDMEGSEEYLDAWEEEYVQVLRNALKKELKNESAGDALSMGDILEVALGLGWSIHKVGEKDGAHTYSVVKGDKKLSLVTSADSFELGGKSVSSRKEVGKALGELTEAKAEKPEHTIKSLKAEGYQGPDASLLESLEEYGMAWKEEGSDWRFIYRIKGDGDLKKMRFAWGHIAKNTDPMKEWGWIKQDDWTQMFGEPDLGPEEGDEDMKSAVADIVADEAKANLPQLVYTLVNHFGEENIFGSTYHEGFKISKGDEEVVEEALADSSKTYPGPVTVDVSFSKVTPESAEEGDAAEHGFEEEDVKFNLEDLDLEEGAEGATAEEWARAIYKWWVRKYGMGEASSSRLDAHTWYNSPAEEDYKDGSTTTYSLHLNDVPNAVNGAFWKLYMTGDK